MLSIANHQGNGNPNYGELSTSALLKRQLSEEKKSIHKTPSAGKKVEKLESSCTLGY